MAVSRGGDAYPRLGRPVRAGLRLRACTTRRSAVRSACSVPRRARPGRRALSFGLPRGVPLSWARSSSGGIVRRFLGRAGCDCRQARDPQRQPTPEGVPHRGAPTGRAERRPAGRRRGSTGRRAPGEPASCSATSATVTRSGQRSAMLNIPKSHSTALTVSATLMRREVRAAMKALQVWLPALGPSLGRPEVRRDAESLRGAAGRTHDLPDAGAQGGRSLARSRWSSSLSDFPASRAFDPQNGRIRAKSSWQNAIVGEIVILRASGSIRPTGCSGASAGCSPSPQSTSTRSTSSTWA